MNEHQRPEGAAIAAALKRSGMSARKAADRAGISDARWRQIVNGYQSVGAGQSAFVVGPPETIARMARVVGLTSVDLIQAQREDAASALAELSETVSSDSEDQDADIRYRKPEGWSEERWQQHRSQLNAIHNALLDQAAGER